MNEFPLVLFTLMIQFSVGVLFYYEVVFPLGRKGGRGYSAESRDYYTIGIVIITASMFSVLHLGSPFRLLNSLENLESSWLSREILLLIIFVFLFLLRLLLKSKTNNYLIGAFFSLTLPLSGLLLVYSMSRIYMIETVPAWNTIFTPLSFYISIFLMGSFFVTVSKNYKPKFQSYFLLLLLIVSILSSIYFVLFISSFFPGNYIIVTRVILLLYLTIILLLDLQSAKGGQEIKYSSFFILIVAEVIGRLVFYASFEPIGL